VTLEGPAGERPSQVAIDRIPDPAGTLREILSHDPVWVRSLAVAGQSRLPVDLATVVAPELAGIELRSGVRIGVTTRTGPTTVQVPLALVRHGMPWVVVQIQEVAKIASPAPGFPAPDLASVLSRESVEAAFTVAIDPAGRWQMTRLRRLRAGGRSDPPPPTFRRCSARPG
jgi:hypothetical protein